MDGILRRRGMVKKTSGTTVVVWFDQSKSSEGTSVGTSTLGGTKRDDYNNNPPDRIIIRVYAVTPENGTVSQQGRLSLWRSGVSQQRNFCGASGSSNTTKKSFNTGDGSEVSVECILTKTSGKTYSFQLTTNTGATNSGTYSWTANANDFFTLRDTTMLGVGTRIYVALEYDN